MSKLQRVIDQLSEGCELCGICGKDITGRPNCEHLVTEAVSYSTAFQKSCHGVRSIQRIPPHTMRIGMELLLYPEYLQTLPLFDSTSKIAKKNALYFTKYFAGFTDR